MGKGTGKGMGSYATGGLDKLKESMCGLFCGEQLFRILLKSTESTNLTRARGTWHSSTVEGWLP